MSDCITIQLTREQTTVISSEDAPLALLKWYARFSHHYGSNGGYVVVRNIPDEVYRQKTEYLHRVILSRVLDRPLLSGEQVDHIDLNPLNNHRDNLRLATNAENCMNRRKRRDNTSGYKGVSFEKESNRWIAQISIDGKQRKLGRFVTAEEAYLAYCHAAKLYYGEFARLE